MRTRLCIVHSVHCAARTYPHTLDQGPNKFWKEICINPLFFHKLSVSASIGLQLLIILQMILSIFDLYSTLIGNVEAYTNIHWLHEFLPEPILLTGLIPSTWSLRQTLQVPYPKVYLKTKTTNVISSTITIHLCTLFRNLDASILSCTHPNWYFSFWAINCSFFILRWHWVINRSDNKQNILYDWNKIQQAYVMYVNGTTYWIIENI